MATPAQTAALDARVTDRFSFTASSGATGPRGSGATITWGIAAEGSPAPVSGPTPQSSLVGFLDSIRDPASTGGTDLTQRSWFTLLEQSTNRIAELSGVTFNFEPNDDGSTLGTLTPAGTGVFPGPGGILGTRADIRIGAANIDGGGGTLAFALGPNSGDVVIDTADAGFFGGTANNSRGLRNVLTHELFHSLGIEHVESFPGDENLLNPFINLGFDGPQLDDILTLQRNYGDNLESLGGNDSLATASQLGLLSLVSDLTVGQEVDDTRIDISESGFLSINNEDDVDLFEFSVGDDSLVTLLLNPEGATYEQGVEGTFFGSLDTLNSLTLNDLTLRVLDASGNLVASANSFGLGGSESITEALAAGTYFAEVSGDLDEIQLFSLNISAVSAVPEPSSAVILIGGLALLQLRRRRR